MPEEWIVAIKITDMESLILTNIYDARLWKYKLEG